MYQGIKIAGDQFFDLLMDSDEFCIELGKLTLAASQLEGEMILFLRQLKQEGDIERFNMGRLIKRLKSLHVVERGVISWLEEECDRRNYLTHNIYHLLNDIISETILERNDIIDSDVHTYAERAWQTRENLQSLSKLIRNSRENA